MNAIRRVKTLRPAFLLVCVGMITLTGKAQPHGLDNPAPLKLGDTFKMSLYENEEHHLKISLPAGRFKVILDSRRVDGKNSNIQGRLSILNSDGVVIKADAIFLNLIGFGQRKVYPLTQRTPATLILKLANLEFKQKYWLTVLKESDPTFIPFFGEITPQPMNIDLPVRGTLDRDASVYYSASLPRGDYKATLNFALTSNEKSNVIGHLYTLDGDGGNIEQVILINAINNSFRKSGVFSVRAESRVIFKIQNDAYPVDYKLTIEPGAP
jgi:hypothetical protein